MMVREIKEERLMVLFFGFFCWRSRCMDGCIILVRISYEEPFFRCGFKVNMASVGLVGMGVYFWVI